MTRNLRNTFVLDSNSNSLDISNTSTIDKSGVLGHSSNKTLPSISAICETCRRLSRRSYSEYNYCTADIIELTQLIIMNSKTPHDTIKELLDINEIFDTMQRLYNCWHKNPIASTQVDYDLLALLSVFRACTWFSNQQHKIIEEYITDITDGYTNWEVLFPVQSLRIAVERALKGQVTGIVQGRYGTEIWFRECYIGSSQVSGMVVLTPCYIQIKDVIDGSMYTYNGCTYPMSPLDLEDILMSCPNLWVYSAAIGSSNLEKDENI
ncbi:uncharacterized protein CMU_008070 [Cryptosporidium muris RN66]|uniref:Uncharacterized protein n=1 Tax=Cryptosporidium muris (strain RN66) TaxID=441375 RepID=B6ADM5_CRYMR|nr:uncharacterized protein CMU_008070 [Cryptosporidium muris RN66]EEA06316.1 hypothetical protein, conserved [Cryptosporidium muris RN66]|eukprot:XP_002140665.1 hypothetical protein [Cryptosporidium muris RN66]